MYRHPGRSHPCWARRLREKAEAGRESESEQAKKKKSKFHGIKRRGRGSRKVGDSFLCHTPTPNISLSFCHSMGKRRHESHTERRKTSPRRKKSSPSLSGEPLLSFLFSLQPFPGSREEQLRAEKKCGIHFSLPAPLLSLPLNGEQSRPPVVSSLSLLFFRCFSFFFVLRSGRFLLQPPALQVFLFCTSKCRSLVSVEPSKDSP